MDKEAQKPVLRFGVVTDTHYAQKNVYLNRYYREAAGKLKKFIAHMNREKVDFIVHLGDFKDEGNIPSEEETLGFLKEVEAVYRKFQGPRYHVLGNHDMDSISKAQFLAEVENTGIAKDASWYAFNKNGIQFIVLDANFKKGFIPYDHGNFDWRESYLPPGQIEWLQQQLEKNDSPTIIFVHQVLDPHVEKDYQVSNGDQARIIIQQHKQVKAVFQGHIHEYVYHKIKGVHYWCIPAMVEGSRAHNTAYAVVEIYKDGNVLVKGFGW